MPEIAVNTHATGDADLDAVLHALVSRVRAVLGERLIAAYLTGSFAQGAGDADSDVDFMMVVDRDITLDESAPLLAVHHAVYDLGSRRAKHLEGSYFPRAVLKQHDDCNDPLLYIDNGSREFERSTHDNTRVVRRVAREHGMTLFGPPARDMIDPVPDDALKAEVRAVLRDWGGGIVANPEGRLTTVWSWTFAVLSHCRIAQTLATGRVTSKPEARDWALAHLDPRWAALIQRAWALRPNPTIRARSTPESADVAETVAFVQAIQSLYGSDWTH
jgi:predicted nucleotidyltransferase